MKFVALILGLSLSASAFADTYVNGYTKANGTFVPGHYRSDANKTTYDNWNTDGNTNPYTGVKGEKSATTTPTYPTYTPKKTRR